MSKKYITTTLPYANSVPHIGHAFEFIIGDALARYFRIKLGDENVHFNIGLDEHGKKIYDSSVAAGKPTIEYLNELNLNWKEFCSKFNIQYNSFYRTSHPKHYALVEKFWNHCIDEGLIYKALYTGKYCVGCEANKFPKDLVDGKCPDHVSLEIQDLEETNYFFALTKFKAVIAKWASEECYLRPSTKHEELKNLIEDIRDIPISRYKETVPWGIPVPNDPAQVVYVWFEALLNYIFIIGYYDEDKSEFEEYWNDSVQIFGPDNLRFQAVILQGLLQAAEVSHTKRLLCHGTILDKDGKKISKTDGNVIDPIDQLNKYGADAVRYYALAGLQIYANSGWNEEQLINLYNSHLANNYGNLVTRTVHLISTKQIDLNSELPDEYNKFSGELQTVGTFYDVYDINAALHALNDVITSANQYFTSKEPWAKTSTDSDIVLRTVHKVLLEATKYYLPIIPNKGKEVFDSLRNLKKEIIFPKIELNKA